MYTPDTLDLLAREIVKVSAIKAEAATVDNRIAELNNKQQRLNEIKERAARLAGRKA